MSRNGKLKKAHNVEMRRLQMEEAIESATLKPVAVMQTAIPFKTGQGQSVQYIPLKERPEGQAATLQRRAPKQCSFSYCRRYVDSTCTVCPYCGQVLPG